MEKVKGQVGRRLFSVGARSGGFHSTAHSTPIRALRFRTAGQGLANALQRAKRLRRSAIPATKIIWKALRQMQFEVRVKQIYELCAIVVIKGTRETY